MNCIPTTAPKENGVAQSRPGLISGALKLSTAQIARRIFRLICFVLVARRIAPSTFGTYAVLLTCNELIALLAGGAYIDLLTREGARNAQFAKSFALQIIRLRISCLVPLGICEFVVLDLLHLSVWFKVAGLLFLTLCARIWTEAVQGALRAQERLSGFLVLECVQGAMLLSGAAIVLSVGPSLISVALVEVFAAFTGAATAAWLLCSMHSPETLLAAPRISLRKVLPFNLYPLIGNVYDRADIMLLAKLAGESAAGVYALPYRAFASLQLIPYGLLGALLPRISGEYNFRTKQFGMVLEFLYVAALLVISETMIFGDTIVQVFLGQRYAASAVVLKILVWATIPSFLNFSFNACLLARNQERVFVITASICTVFNVAMNIIFIPHFAFRAAALITVATELLLLTQNCFFLRRSLGFIPFPRHFLSVSVCFVVLVVCIINLPRGFMWPLSTLCLGLSFVFLLTARKETSSLRSSQAAAEVGL